MKQKLYELYDRHFLYVSHPGGYSIIIMIIAIVIKTCFIVLNNKISLTTSGRFLAPGGLSQQRHIPLGVEEIISGTR